jgi:hypothetical protein
MEMIVLYLPTFSVKEKYVSIVMHMKVLQLKKNKYVKMGQNWMVQN